MRVALGELHWPPEQAYYCDVNAILLAAEGQAVLLCRIGVLRPASPSVRPRGGPPQKLTARAFDFMTAPARPRRGKRRA